MYICDQLIFSAVVNIAKGGKDNLFKNFAGTTRYLYRKVKNPLFTSDHIQKLFGLGHSCKYKR
jgi:hypothetical protein